MPLQIADTANSPLSHSMHIFVKVKCFHLGEVSKVVNWICGTDSCIQQIRMLNILPLPMYIQSLNLLLLSELSNEPQNSIELLQTQDMLSRSNELFKLPKTRTEKMRKEFVFRTSRLANKVSHLIDFSSSTGLKKRIIQLLWKFVETKFNENNTCTWQLACDCQNCREKWTIF